MSTEGRAEGNTMDLRSLRFGVEIETVKRTRGCVAEAIRTVVGGRVRHVGTPRNYDPWEVIDERGRVWKVVADASLTSVHPNYRAEVVSPVLTYEDLPQLQEVVRAVRTLAGARSDAHCGVHVHIDAAAFDGRKLANLAKLTYQQEELIIRALGITSSRLGRYCRRTSEEFMARLQRTKPRTRDQFNLVWYGYRNTCPARFDSSRYRILNLNSVWYRNTVEVRAFGGTLHAGKVKAYVQFCLALAAKALTARSASSRKRQPTGTSDKYDFRCFMLLCGAPHNSIYVASSVMWSGVRCALRTPAFRPKSLHITEGVVMLLSPDFTPRGKGVSDVRTSVPSGRGAPSACGSSDGEHLGTLRGSAPGQGVRARRCGKMSLLVGGLPELGRSGEYRSGRSR